jgi:hypothetical protein
MNKSNSQSISKILTIILSVSFIISIIALINTIIYMVNFSLYTSIATFDRVVMLAVSMFYVIIAILYAIWIYKVHKDLKFFSPYYPVSPGEAVGFYFIPVLNIYWQFHVPAKIASFLKKQSLTSGYGTVFATLWPIALLLGLVHNGLNLYTNSDFYIDISAVFITDLLLVLFVFILLRTNAMVIKSVEVLHAQHTENVPEENTTSYH